MLAGMKTDGGVGSLTAPLGSVLLSVMVTPPAGAGLVSVMVPLSACPPGTAFGLNTMDVNEVPATGATLIVALTVTPSFEAEISDVWFCVTPTVLIGNDTKVLLVGIITVDGTLAYCGLLLVTVTGRPPGGAGLSMNIT